MRYDSDEPQSSTNKLIGGIYGIHAFSGGLQISFALDNWCTMGPTVRWRQNPSGPFTTGYITASHCTPPVGGGVNFTEFFQPVPLTGNFAGTEIRDPLFTRQRCWDEGQLCRESDAALINYVNPDPRLVTGTIYKTENRSRILGSRGIPTYEARIKYEDGSVNYQWSRRFEGSSTWINLGTNKTQTVWVNIIDVTDFDIRVEVQDDSNSDMAQQHVTVQDN